MLPACLQFCYPEGMRTAADEEGTGALEGQMRAMLDDYWSGADGRRDPEPAELRQQRWFAALDGRNWRVPGWPRRCGGEGWSRRELAAWYRLCALAGAPLPDPLGSAVVGPLVIEHGSAAQQRAWLPAMRLGAGRWHLAGLPGTRAGVGTTTLEPVVEPGPRGGLRLHGAVQLVDAAGPDDGLCLATPAGLALIDLAGVEVQPLAAGSRVSLAGVAVGASARLGDAARAEALAWQAQHRFWQLQAPAAQARRLQQLIAALPELARGDGVADDLRRRLVEIDAAIYGVEALTRRSLADPGREELALLVALRAAGLLSRLDALAGEALAYAALPVAAPRGDNRPRIGHHSGLSAHADAGAAAVARLQAALAAARRQPALADDLVRDRLARAL